MFYLILFALATIALIIFWRRNVFLYKAYYTGTEGYFNLRAVQMFETIHRGGLVVDQNFLNYNLNMALHLVICGVLLFVISVTESILITTAYLLIVILKWKVYSMRKAAYQDSLTIYTSGELYGVYSASISVPIFCTIVFALLEIAYIFAP